MRVSAFAILCLCCAVVPGRADDGLGAPPGADLTATVPPVSTSATDDSADHTRGIIRAREEAWLSSEIGLPINRLPFKEGDHFKKGDLLIGFECSQLKAQFKAAEARVSGESITLKNNQQLKVHNAIGQYDVELASTKVEQAKAERDAIAATVERCELRAPFDGQVAELRVHNFETPERSAPMMHLLETGHLEVDMIVPSTWLRWMRPGGRFAITVDETGEATAGAIERIAASVDAVSQTVKVSGVLTGDTSLVRPGMSGLLTFEGRP